MTRTLLHAGLSNAVLAAALAVLVAAMARAFRGRPALVHGLWLLVLLKLVTPPVLPAPLPWPEQDRENPISEEEEAVTRGCPCSPSLAPAEPGDLVAVAHVPPDPPRPPVASAAPGASTPAVRGAPDWPAAVVALWLAGAAVCWSLAGARLLRLWRVFRELPAESGEISDRLKRLAERLGLCRLPRCWLVPGVTPPMLLVVGRTPRLLLPGELWRRLNETQRDALLLHELAHLRRGDHLVRWLELLVLGLYWWHPAAWWAISRLRDAEEECCDAWVVWAAPESAPAYAAALVETVAFLSREGAELPPLASGASPVRLMKRRLTMILRGGTPRHLSWAALAGVLLFGAWVLPLAPEVRSQAPAKEGRPGEETPVATNRLIAEQKSCLACHVAVHKQPPFDKKMQDVHAEVVRLLKEVEDKRSQWTKAEAALKEAMKRLADQQHQHHPMPPPKRTKGDPRLEKLEKKLERLLKEVESLRREIRSGKGTPSAARGDIPHLNQRTLHVECKVNPESTARKLLLYVSTDRGKTYRLASTFERYRTSDGKEVPVERFFRFSHFAFTAPHDGVFGFQVATVDADGKQSPAEVAGRPPLVTMVVDTVAPVVEVTEVGALFGPGIRWRARDSNLLPGTLKVEFRKTPEGQWQPVSVKPAAAGQLVLHRDAAGGEVRVSVRDKAGNVGEATVKLRER
jgi:beta-lactamase regulating signal transducer with metallopeptidase domain